MKVTDNINPTWYHLAIPYLMFGVLITVENALCLLVIYKSKIIRQGQSSKYLFTASLGVTDLLTGMTMVAMATIFAPSLAFHHYNSRELEISLSGAACGMFMISVIHMAVIAVERYLFITRPFFHQKHLTSRTIVAVIGLNWCLGLAVLLALTCGQVQLVGVGVASREQSESEPDRPSDVDCVAHRVYSGLYLLLTFVAFVSYWLILLQVKKHRHAMSTLGGRHTTASSQVPKWREQAKSLKFFMTVFGFYFLTTFPTMCVINLCDDVPVSLSVQYLLGGIAMTNSAMNFVILCIIDSKFRRILKNVFLGRCKCKGTSETNSYNVQ